MELFTNFSHVVSEFVVTKNCIVMVICLFRNGMRNVITPLWMIIKTSLTVLFILFCNGFITFSASKIWKEAKLLKSDVFKSTRYKSKWASGIFEQWQKEGLIRVINIQIKKGVHWSLMLYQTQGFDVF